MRLYSRKQIAAIGVRFSPSSVTSSPPALCKSIQLTRPHRRAGLTITHSALRTAAARAWPVPSRSDGRDGDADGPLPSSIGPAAADIRVMR